MNFDHDDHTHTTLHELQECLAYQRRRMSWQMAMVFALCLITLGYLVVR